MDTCTASTWELYENSKIYIFLFSMSSGSNDFTIGFNEAIAVNYLESSIPKHSELYEIIVTRLIAISQSN